jgi:hypothetical protein
MSKVNKTGRSKGEPHHVRLYDWMMNCDAWKALTAQERATYIEVERRFFGANNGTLAVSARTIASACNVSKDTATKCFARLMELGFLECMQVGSFTWKVKHASEWRLTRAACDRTGSPATKAFMKWRLPVTKNPKAGPERGTDRSQTKDKDAA